MMSFKSPHPIYVYQYKQNKDSKLRVNTEQNIILISSDIVFKDSFEVPIHITSL